MLSSAPSFSRSTSRRVWTRAVALAVAPVMMVAASAVADPVLVTSNTTLTSSDTLFPGTTVPVALAEVTVQNATLTINGEVTITSLTVGSGGVVTHTPGFTYDADPGPAVQTVGGFHLHTSTFVTVSASGVIDVGARGWDGGQGPGAGAAGPLTNECAGGGGYGGSGGTGTNAAGGGTYGSFSQPTDLGSGGGASNTITGKRGGGAIRLTIGGALTVNGEISADGANYDGTYSGAGSGGSIWITAATVTGSGTIHANGRGYTPCSNGGGGGGRVAVYGDLSTFTGANALQARGAATTGPGCGTVYRAQIGQPAQLIFDNGGTANQSVQSSPIVTPAGVNVIIRNGAALSHASGSTSGLLMQIADNLTIDATGLIDASSRGYAGGQGPGAGSAGSTANECAGGGGYGGSGGTGTSVSGGGTYGSFNQPTDLGSGGGASTTVPGKRGGGAIRLTVGGTLTVSGEISADGASYDGTYSGAGSGGSIWINAATVTGAGTIHANGRGYTPCSNGGGGGGRVAVYGDLSTFTGANALQARGAATTGPGCGTVYRAQTGQSAQLIFDNGGTANPSVLSTPLVTPAGVNVIIRNGAALTHAPGNTSGLLMQVADNLTIDSTGLIDAGGRGYAGGQGPGAGADGVLTNECAGGGGYGGSGGAGTNVAGGGTYGSFSQPTDLGSGGGASNTITGKRGGGAIRLTVGGTLTVNGEISADGANYDGTYSGAGSGGSIWITAATVIGSGTIHANGRGYTPCSNGGGGGGRVAVYGDLSTFTGANALQARGAATTGPGCGTVYRAQIGQPAQLIFDNGGTANQSVQSSPIVTPAGVNVIIRNGAALSHASGSVSGLVMQVADNLTIESTGLIDAGGRGYAGGQGPGAGAAGVLTNECAGGAGYGGAGGAGTTAAGGGAYGSATQPTDLGSGGGASTTVPGKRGGGAIRLKVGGSLTVNGEIGADGALYDGTYSGAGSGGSIWITAATVTGAGTIHANGRGYTPCSNGGGGGGRVAVYSCNMTMPLSSIVANGAVGAGAGTTYFNATAVSVVVSIVGGGNRCPGATVALTADTINGTSYQWRRDNVPMADGPGIGGTTYSGVATPTLTVTNVSPIDGHAEITCVVNNACGLVTSTPSVHLICAGDFNCSGSLSVQDIFDFLNAWFAADPRADFNGGGLSVQDIFDFLNAWFAGC